MRFCRSRNHGRRCTRELGHRGLHRHRAILWAYAAADAAACPGSGAPGTPASTLPDGFPDDRAVCPECQRFVPLDADGLLVAHDTWDPAETDAERTRAREWFNTFGW